MIKKLKELESTGVLWDLFKNGDWKSLDIDYHPPHVERLWLDYEDYRIYLHVLHPCSRKEALLHPHPWESAVHVLGTGSFAKYEQGIGFHEIMPPIMKRWKPEERDVIVMTQEIQGSMYYEMMAPEARHYVRPIGGPVYSIMLAGPVKWPENDIKSDKKLGPIDPERLKEIRYNFAEMIPQG